MAVIIIIAFLPMKLLEEKAQREPVTQNTYFRSIRSQKLFQIDVLKNFTIFTGKHLCWSLFLSSCTPECSNTSVFLWILRSFYKRLFFCRTPPVAVSVVLAGYWVEVCHHFDVCKYCSSIKWNFWSWRFWQQFLNIFKQHHRKIVEFQCPWILMIWEWIVYSYTDCVLL